MERNLNIYLYNISNRLEYAEKGKFGPSSVSVQMLAAPINPADINQIQGYAHTFMMVYYTRQHNKYLFVGKC